MNLVPKKLSRTVARKVLRAKKNSPHIFFAAGVVGAIGSTALACRATLKVSDVLEDLEHDAKQVKELGDSAIANPENSYSEGDFQTDIAYVYGKGAGRIIKLYAPAAILGTVSVMALTGSHIQLARRNAALTGALGVVSSAFETYRGRVRDELGKEKEAHIFHDVVEEERTVDGKKVTVPVLSDPTGNSVYARFFDEVSPNWTKDAEYNRLFVQAQQNYFNHLLHSRGHVFLNEVYDLLGMERSKEGAVVGWVYDPYGQNEGDNFIDFGIFEVYNRDFVNGNERSILLDFNVDGVIYNLI